MLVYALFLVLIDLLALCTCPLFAPASAKTIHLGHMDGDVIFCRVIDGAERAAISLSVEDASSLAVVKWKVRTAKDAKNDLPTTEQTQGDTELFHPHEAFRAVDGIQNPRQGVSIPTGMLSTVDCCADLCRARFQ